MALPLRGDNLPDEDFEALNAEGEEDDMDDEPDESYETDDEATEEEIASAAAKEVAIREKERLRQQGIAKKQQLEKVRALQNATGAETDAARGQKRLAFLLKQAEVFQHFAPSASDLGKKEKRGRHSAKYTEEMEDKELMADEETATEVGHRLTVQPSCIKFGQMRDYQLQGLNWLIHLYDNGINGILADEMGLGKTLQTISLIGYLHEYRGITGPHMVIVPKSTIGNWMKEFARWCPMIRATKFIGNAEERQAQKDQNLQPGKFDVVVTSYEMVIKEKAHFRKFHWRYIIIDEAHRIKNENSLLSKTVRLFRTNYRLLITGTPLQNNLHELWALLNFLLPEVFASAEKFDEWFNISDPNNKEAEAEVVQQLHKVLRPFLLRRLKSDVEKGLPPKKETILKMGMSEMQKKYYAALLQKDIEAITAGADRSRLLNIVMQLRKCCNHPYLFQGAEPGPPFTTGEHLVENSGKMVLLDRLLPKLQERGSRVLIFSQMTRLLDVLEDYCLYRGYKYCRIDGNTSGEDREAAIEAYNAPGSEKFIFLLSTRAGGLGINLYTADIVVLFDSDWNPQMDLQAMDRAHRIGQKKEVHVYRFCIDNSIEEKVIEKAYKKLRLDALVIQQGRLTESTKGVNKDDLLSMVRYGAEMVFNNTSGTVTAEDIDAIIAKGVRDTEQLNKKLQEFSKDAMKFTMDGGFNAYDFKAEDEEEDADMEKLKALAGANWVDPPERKRKRLVNYNESEQYRSMKASGVKGPAGPRLPKMPQLQDFQFFAGVRLQEIYAKEAAFETFRFHQAQKKATLLSQGATEEAATAEVLPTEEDPQPLSEAEVAERDLLLESGFSNWNRRDFNAFVRAAEKHGRVAIKEIAQEIDGKTEDDVRKYAAVFWDRYRELPDWDRHIKTIEKGEARIKRQKDIMAAIEVKLNRYRNPWQELKLSYGANKGKAYTEEEDRFVLCMMAKLGYGAWDELKAEIRKSWRFRFDWFFKSRTPQELSRRCETLIRLVEKENEDLDARDTAKGGKKGGSSKAGGSSSKEGGPAASGAAAGGSSRKRKSAAAGAAGLPPSAKKGRSSASPAPVGV